MQGKSGRNLRMAEGGRAKRGRFWRNLGVSTVALATLGAGLFGARAGGENAARNIVESERSINASARTINDLHAEYAPYNIALAKAAKPHAIRAFGFTEREYAFLANAAVKNNFPVVRSIDALAWALDNGGIKQAREKLGSEITEGEFNTETFKHFVILSALEREAQNPALKGVLSKVESKLGWLAVPKDLPHEEDQYTRFGKELSDHFKQNDYRSFVNASEAQQLYHDIAWNFKDMVKSKNSQYWSNKGVYWAKTVLPYFAEGKIPALMRKADGLALENPELRNLLKRRK